MRDHLIVLAKPKKPDWMSPYQYDQVPETLKVRELQAGQRVKIRISRTQKGLTATALTRCYPPPL